MKVYIQGDTYDVSGEGISMSMMGGHSLIINWF